MFMVCKMKRSYASISLKRFTQEYLLDFSGLRSPPLYILTHGVPSVRMLESKLEVTGPMKLKKFLASNCFVEPATTTRKTFGFKAER